jgi:hypothetical protein
MTGFGQVHPPPGIWDSLHLDTAVTLPVGVEAYPAYALRAWLSASGAVSARTPDSVPVHDRPPTRSGHPHQTRAVSE